MTTLDPVCYYWAAGFILGSLVLIVLALLVIGGAGRDKKENEQEVTTQTN